MIIGTLKEELELLETLEFKKVNAAQKQMLKNDYNFYTAGLEYAEDDWGNVIFICSNDTLRNMEYYLGLEYDKDYIEYKMSNNRKTIVSYSGSERAEKLLGKLRENEIEESVK